MSDFKKRIFTGLIMLVLALAALWQGGYGFDILVVAISVLMLREWVTLFPMPIFYRLSALLVLSFSLALAVIAPTIWGLKMACAALLMTSLALGLARKLGGNRLRAAMGLAYAGLPAVALIWMRAQPQGLYFVLWTLSVVWATDICAYFTGRSVGGPKIAPAISPSKTWAGLVGGMTGAALLSFVVADFAGWTLNGQGWIFPMAGAVAALCAQTGDFFESWLKRQSGVKDSGSLLPGHGGLLDRMDGVVPVSLMATLILVLR